MNFYGPGQGTRPRLSWLAVDSIGGIQVFVQVAESGSFVAAGRALGISASAVGKSITRLEERAGARLFQRTNRSLALTPEGSRFLERCQRILEELRTAEAELAETAESPRGLLRISMPRIGGHFLAILSEFQVAHPAVDLEIDFSNRIVDLVREGFDAALRAGPMQDSSLTARDLGGFRHVLVASPAYLGRRPAPRTPEDLRDHDRLKLRLPNSGRLESVVFADRSIIEPPAARVPFVANSADALIHFAVAGHGIAHALDFLVEREIASGALVEVLPEHMGAIVPLRLVWSGARYMSPRLRSFVDWMTARLRRR